MRADVGVALGQRVCEVAREVSDLVLLDDNFATIVSAIDEGRNIYDNIQKFIRFTFATNVALSLLVLGGAIGAYLIALRDSSGALILPLSAIQVLFINFIGDGPPALALAVDRNPAVMLRPPSPFTNALLDRRAFHFILFSGLLQGAVGLGALWVLPGYGFTVGAIQSFVFAYESCAKVASVFPARRVTGRPAPNAVLYGTTAFGIGLTLACLYVPTLRSALDLDRIPLPALLAAATLVAVTLALTELFVAIERRLQR
jgi:Ca2+-transporting ATPase